MKQLDEWWKRPDFSARKTFDLVLAITLEQNGVKAFHTRNAKDLDTLGLFEVVDSLA